MKVPPMCSFSVAKIQRYSKKAHLKLPEPPLRFSKDTITFSSNTKYIKKYNTLPPEIKQVLSPKDAIDMFKEMEMVAKGTVKRKKIGQGNQSKVYENPWLDDYYFIVLKDGDIKSQIIYSRNQLGDAVWSDNENSRIQIIKKAS